MVFGDESENISEQNFEDITNFTDDAFEYYINNRDNLTIDDTSECDDLILTATEFEKLLIESNMQDHEEVNMFNC